MTSLGPRARKLLKLALAALVLVLIASAFQRAALEVLRTVSRVDPMPLVAGLLLCILYRVLNSSGWVFVLRGLNQPMPLARGMRLWLLAESMRWVPGSIWGFCSRVYQATQCGITPAVASASLPLELFLTIGAWVIAAAGGMLISGQAVNWASLLSPRLILIAGAGAAVVAAIVAIWLLRTPGGRIGGKLKALRGQIAELRRIEMRPALLAGVLLFYTALCCLNGIAFSFILRAVSDVEVNLFAVIGINAFGWLVGFLAVGAPGGIGVREAGAAFLLSAIIPLPEAIAASVLWRMVMIVDEVTCLGVCLTPRLAGRWDRPTVEKAA